MIYKNQKNNIIIEAEQNILAIAAHSINGAKEIFSILNDQDFITTKFKIIFKSLNELFINKKSIDIITLSNYMLTNNQLNKIGGIESLTDVFQKYTTDAYLQEYLDIIINNTISRKLQNIIKQINTNINLNHPIQEIINTATKEILNINDKRKNNIFKKSSDEVDKVIKKIEILENAINYTTGSPSGFEDLDKITAGFQKGDFIILAGRPSMGKTALALNFAFNCAKITSDVVVIFSIEMQSEQLIQRMIGSIASIDTTKIKNGQGLTKSEWNKIIQSAEQIKNIKLLINDSPNLKIQDLQLQLQQLYKKYKISLVIIDYLQLLNIGLSNNESRHYEITIISRQLKTLSRELNIPIICLSQLSRSVEKREDKKPIMSDLRDSGAIEQDADIIMFLYREEYYNYKNLINNNNNSNSIMSEKAQLILSKHRNGPTGKINILFVKKYGSFANYGGFKNKNY